MKRVAAFAGTWFACFALIWGVPFALAELDALESLFLGLLGASVGSYLGIVLAGNPLERTL